MLGDRDVVTASVRCRVCRQRAGLARPRGAGRRRSDRRRPLQPALVPAEPPGIGDDLQAATDKGKRFAIIWELRGCPYCKDTHLVNFAKPEIENYIKERSTSCSSTSSARAKSPTSMARSCPRSGWRRNTAFASRPRFSFSRARRGSCQKKPRDREVTRAQGYLEPRHFLAMFRFVAERAYEKGTLHDFLKANR